MRALRKHFFCIWLLFLIIGITLQSVTVHPASPSAYPALSVSPALCKAETTGVTFQINVTIQDVTDLAGIEFKLSYNTTVLTATLIEYGGIFGPDYFPLMNMINDTRGFLRYALMENWGEPTFNGSGIIAKITFEATTFGSSLLELSDTKLGDSKVPPNPIVHTTVDGFFFNTAFHDIAVTQVKASPAEVKANEIITVNITVTNEGNYTESFNVIVYADATPYEYVLDTTGKLVDVNVVVGDEISVATQVVTGLAAGANKTLTVYWNTTGVEGTYTISAKSLLSDNDTRDNLLIGNTVKIIPPLKHDISVTSVVASPDEVTIGENVTITVTVKNEGNFSETFDVTVYYDSTAIETKTDITLVNGTSTTLTLTWGTTGVLEKTYTISAKVPPVEGESENDKADNTYAGNAVRVKGVTAPNIVVYAAVGIIAIVVAVVLIYFWRFRK